MTRKTHDAELCERIRVLEERVKELEARPQTIVYPTWPHYCWPGCPQHYGTGWYPSIPWTITYGANTSDMSTGATYIIGDMS